MSVLASVLDIFDVRIQGRIIKKYQNSNIVLQVEIAVTGCKYQVTSMKSASIRLLVSDYTFKLESIHK